MNRALKITLLGVALLGFIGVIFWGATFVEEQEGIKNLISKFGFVGIVVLGLISGFNLLIPIHAAAFTPVLLAAEFSLPTIILALAIGTTTADLLSFVLGRFGKNTSRQRYPVVYEKVTRFMSERRAYVIPGIFLYSAFVPFPNEVMMLPLGLFGFCIKKAVVPLVLGTIVNQTIFVLGFAHVFELVF